MANVKEIVIRGDIHSLGVREAASDDYETYGDFSEEEHEAAKTIMNIIATMAFPSFGLRISFSGKRREVEPNKHGGVDIYDEYEIAGCEAIRFEYFDEIVAALRLFGNIEVDSCYDLEA